MNAKLTLIYSSQQNGSFDQRPHDCEAPMRAVITADVTEFTVYQWFTLFERILAAAGFCDYDVMDGACQLAFNDTRNHSHMRTLYKEYELADFSTDTTLEVCDDNNTHPAAA